MDHQASVLHKFIQANYLPIDYTGHQERRPAGSRLPTVVDSTNTCLFGGSASSIINTTM